MLLLKKILPVFRLILLTGLAAVLFESSVNAAQPEEEDFGRFFTTPKQRERLDEIRNATSDVVVNINENELQVDEDVKQVEQQHNELTLKGVVSRSDGKNTAWINDSNSYEGDVASGVTRVEEHEIKPGGVEMELPGDKKRIHLKVGEAYDSAAGKTNDNMPEDDIIRK